MQASRSRQWLRKKNQLPKQSKHSPLIPLISTSSDRSDCIFIQLTLNEGRAVEQKQCLYKAVTEGFRQRLSLRREDVFVNLGKLSFGNGEAQYVIAPQ
jgi:hypothetical protein